MNPNISKLNRIAQKNKRVIIGLMSGTSLDGLDIALCSISGAGSDTMIKLEQFVTKEYTDDITDDLRAISSVESADLANVCYLHTRLAQLHADWILESLDKWGFSPNDVDCIASHGQTIYHYPARDQKNKKVPLNTTLQIGDGDHIAAKTGILTISDFRQKHTAHGGEGAPMAGLIDNILFRDPKESRILLNIGGIGNFTYLPAGSETEKEAFTTDTGPGNTLIDKCAQKYFQQPFDRDSEIANTGGVINLLLNRMLADPWFTGKGSKTTGPEYFSLEWLGEKITSAGLNPDQIAPADLIRTVTELSAVTIADHINTVCKKNGGNQVVYVSGGGARNPLLVERLNALMPDFSIENFTKLGVNPDAKEAVLFAVLANEMLAGNGFSFSSASHNKVNDGSTENLVNFGKISFPD